MQREVSQEFSANVQAANTEISAKAQEHRDAADTYKEAALKAEAEGNQELANQLFLKAVEESQSTDNWQRAGVALNMIASGLSAPTQSGAGIAAATLSPAVSYQIGQRFKDLAKQNPDGKLTSEQEAAHILAHAVLGAAVSAAGGNHALAGGLSAGGAEAAAPLISNYLYHTTDSSQLNAEQKQTISTITGLIGTGAGAATGNTTADTVSGSLNAGNAVGNNYLTPYQALIKEQRIQGCFLSKDPECEKKIVQEFDAISLKQDLALAADCRKNPNSSDCRQRMGDALDYVGERGDSYAKQSDINQSRKRVLDVANTNGYSAINDLARRADYFGAMYAYTGQPWFRAAEDVSREDLSMANSTGFSAWVAEAGAVIMKNARNDFYDIYKNYPIYSYNWSERRLFNEQTDPELQRVHEKYYQIWNTPKIPLEAWIVDIKAHGNFLDYRNRMKVGCSKMPEVEACRRWK